jgi:hypothetical protein
MHQLTDELDDQTTWSDNAADDGAGGYRGTSR